MKGILYKALFGLLIFTAVSAGAHAAPVEPGTKTDVASFDYHEECNNEGCDNHEIQELYDSFQHECLVEGCWYEEVRELAGRDSQVDAMFRAFRTKLGKSVQIPQYRPGNTPTFWDWVCKSFGRNGPYGCEFIVKTPPIKY